MKPREFWILTRLDENSFGELGIDNQAVVYHRKPSMLAVETLTYHVREVNPNREKAIEKMVEALETLGLQCVNTGMYGPMKISPGKCTCSTCNAKKALDQWRKLGETK